MNKYLVRALVWWALLIAAAALLWQVMKHQATTPREMEIALSVFVNRVNQGRVSQVIAEGNVFHGTEKDQTHFRTVMPANYSEIYKLLFDKGVGVVVKESDSSRLAIFVNALPIIIMIGLWIYMIRAMPRTGWRWRWPAADPISELQSIRSLVQERVPDDEGHRTQALQAIDRALEEVRRAMAGR